LHIHDKRGTHSTWTTQKTLTTILQGPDTVRKYIQQYPNIETTKKLAGTLAETLLYTAKLCYKKTIDIINKFLTKQTTLHDIATIQTVSYQKILSSSSNTTTVSGESPIKEKINKTLKQYTKTTRTLPIAHIDLARLAYKITTKTLQQITETLEIYKIIDTISSHHIKLLEQQHNVSTEEIQYFLYGLAITDGEYRSVQLGTSATKFNTTRPELLGTLILLSNVSSSIEITRPLLRNVASDIRVNVSTILRIGTNLSNIHRSVQSGALSREEAIYTLAGMIAGDGIVEPDGRVRIAILRHTYKGSHIYDIINKLCKTLSFRIDVVRGNLREISIKCISTELKRTLGYVLQVLTLYDYKARKLVELKPIPYYKKLSLNGIKQRTSTPITVRMLNQEFSITHEWHRTNFEIYLRKRYSNVHERDKVLSFLESNGIKCRRAGGAKYPEIRISWTEILHLLTIRKGRNYTNTLSRLKEMADKAEREGKHSLAVGLIRTIKSMIKKGLEE